MFLDIFVILTSKLIFLWRKNTIQIIRMAIMLSKLPKYPHPQNVPKFRGILVIFRDFKRILLIFRLQWNLGHFNYFQGYCRRFQGVSVFSGVLGYFEHSWCILVVLALLKGPFYRFWFIYRFFDILVILTGKIIFLWQKNTLQIIRMTRLNVSRYLVVLGYFGHFRGFGFSCSF